MHQQRKNIIRTVECGHVILELIRIHRHFFACDHLYDLVTQPVLIQVNVHFQCFIGFCLCPVVAEFSTEHSFYHRLGIVDRNAVYTVTVIPLLCLCKRHLVLLTQTADFLFCKAGKLFNGRGIRHRIFVKSIDGRVLSVFFDG